MLKLRLTVDQEPSTLPYQFFSNDLRTIERIGFQTHYISNQVENFKPAVNNKLFTTKIALPTILRPYSSP
jgi:hypothetical protein